MDCLCATGNAVVGKIAEYTVEPFVRRVGYLIHYNKNLQTLTTQLKNLSDARDGLELQVAEAEIRGEKIHSDVRKWLKDVAMIMQDTEESLKGKCQAIGEPNEVLKDENQANEEPSEVLKDEHQAKMKRPHQFCPNPRLRYQLSRKSTKLVEAVCELYARKDFPTVSYVVRSEELCFIPDEEDYEAFDSRISTTNEIIDELRSPSANIILVYGIGGVGKTTLVEEVLRQVTKDKLFDDAVMVRDVKIPNLEAIQKEIAEKLGLEVLSNQTISGRADRIFERINDKKTLVILDDVWAEIDLKTLGLPHIPTCKIVLTSRTRKLLSSDRIKQKEFLLGELGENEAWLLFEKKAGDVTKDPTILSIATDIAKKCGGLPVFIVTVARALENRSLPVWENALRSLDRFDEKGLTEKAYTGLEWSYAHLNEQLKPLFLLCGITIQGNSISLTNLLKYSMGLGFFKDLTVEQARNALYTQIDKLKSSCLLLDGDDNTCVSMHDLVHDFAIRIATRDQCVLVKDGVDQLKEWPDQDLFKRCSKISWSCCNIPSLPVIPWKCPELEMFRLHGTGEKNDHHLRIPSSFFGKMPKLKVLDICNLPLMLLPPSLALLKTNLQTLCLDGCTLEQIALVGELSNLETLSFTNSKVKELPKEIAKLTHLRLLDLSDCPELEVISPNVISSLTRLEDLRMKNSFEKWEAEGDINKRRNASLLELKDLPQLTALEIYIPDADILPPNLFSNKLERYHIYIGGVWSKCMAETTFNTLKLELAPSNQSDQGLRRLMMRSEDLALDVMEGINNSLYQLDNEGFLHLKRLLLQNNVDLSYINDKKVVFPNLTTLSIKICDHLRFLFSCSMAKSFVQLKHLEIYNCNSMEEVVSSTIEYNEENMNNMFCKLETLELKQLPCLGRICTGTRIEFLSLKKLVISDCYKFKAFICDPMSDKSTRICKEIEERESEESPSVEHETVAQHCLFNDKVRFPSLEELEILGLEELQTIWHNNQLADQDSFCRLKQVDVSYCKSLISMFPPSIMGRLNALKRLVIDSCNSLKVIFEVGGINVEETCVNTSSPYDQLKPLYCQNLEFLSICRADSLKHIFPAPLARSLLQLQYLWVMGCCDLLEIVGEEEGGVELPTPPPFVFPKATDVTLTDLPQLKSFYPGEHVSKWPLLKKLEVFQRNSDKVELSVFQDKHISGPVKSLFPIDQDSFLNLEYLQLGAKEIWYGPPSTAELFGKLMSISFRDCSPFSKQASILFLQRLPNLETIEVIGGPSEEICVNQGNNSSSRCEIHDAVGSWTVPHVRGLKLYGMDNLMCLGGGGMRENSESASANPPFPNLEILEVERCSRLKNLESSAIFWNITTLKVIGCEGLEYLTTYSVAKSLVQLRTMEVRSCEKIVVIVASNIVGDNDPDDVSENEIAFSRLQHLTLADLPSLQGFCSTRNCIMKFSSPITLTVEFCPIELQITPDGFHLSQRTGSRISIMKKLMDELKNPYTSRIGVCGIAAVGKTTLVKEVHKQATKDKGLFDDIVILLDVKSNTDLEGIQKKILEKLGMDIFDNDTIDGRASRLSARIKDKKILVILDDVWEQIDLVAVGLPSVAACKILLTSRIRKTLSDMSTQKEFLLDILQEEESWVLFQEKAGDVVKDPAIRTVAKQVAKNCGGLPILVVTVASALKQRTTLPPWTDALTCLQEGSDREEESAEKAHLGLQWSYKQLNDKELKPLFLLCGITIRGNSISLADLLRYSMGLGFFKKAFTVEQARKALLSRIEKLKDYCLLIDSDDNRCVGMHELVLDVAKRIAFRDQHILSLVEDGGNHELKEWPDKYFLEKCTIMFFPCGNNIPRLPEVMHCPALTMFHLQGDHVDDDSQKISPRLFEEMKNLRVLSFKCMTIPSLPSSLQFLKNLDSLCLDQCILGDVALIGKLSNLENLSFSESNVKQLPGEVGKLTHLRLLDLSDCSELEVISPGVISNLGRLEELRMRNSFNKWEVEGEGSNASLSELKHLSQLSSLEIHIPNADILPANLFSHKLERFNIIIGDVREKLMVETTLNRLKLKLTTSIEQLDEGLQFLVERSEDLSLYTESVNNIFHPLHTKEFEHLKHLQLQSNVDDFTYIINRKVVFPNLPILRVHRCDGLSFLFSFCMPEGPDVELQSPAELKHLEISTYEIMEESLSSRREYSQENVDDMFSKWINLKLNESTDIIRLCSGSIEKLEIEGWIKMNRGCKEIEDNHLEENLDVKRELIIVQYFLFDLKAVFPNLTSLAVHRCDRLSFLFSISMAKSLVELRHLEISTCEIIEEIVSSTGEHGQENMDNMFPKLEDLKLNELPNLTRFCSGSYIQLLSLEKLDIEGCSKLGAFISDNVAMSGENIRICIEIEEKDSEENLDANRELNTAQCFLFDEKIGLPNLTSLMVHRCDGLSFLMLSSMARSLVKLKRLVISECQRMEAVLTKDYDDENKDNMFPELKELELKDLPHLVRFCSGNYFDFASMERLQLEKCAKLETFICNPSSNSIASQKEMERVDTNENLVTAVVPYFLFDKRVGLPRLERLTINDLPKLTKIWHSQLAPNSFCRLRDVTVQQCSGLRNIFPDSIIAVVFQQLQNLIVKQCGVEEIVSQEEGVEKVMHDHFFPKLACLELKSLFQLKRFCLGMPAINLPLLKTLVLFDCQKVDFFPAEFSGLQTTHDLGNLRTRVKQYSVVFEKSSFPKLEHLTLRPMDIWYGRPAHEKALFPAISTDGSLPDLRTLRLHGMEKSMHLWENTEPAAGSAFLQLETLEVKFSGLTNLELSAISFQNLKILEVTFCWTLQYLTTYSVAQSLKQLNTLKVDECKNMKEIFTSEGMGEDASKSEIVFSQLRSLELSDLINLERFCSSNCRVKVPTLRTLNLKVKWCPLKLKISSDNVLEVDLDVQKAHSSKEACSSETNQKRSGPNNNGTQLPGITGSEHGVEAVIQETPIDPQNRGQAEVMDLKQKQIVTNTRKNLQESDFGESLIKPLNANEGKQTQFEARRSELIAGSSQDEAECQEVMGREAELTNIRQQIKVLEARAAILEADL